MDSGLPEETPLLNFDEAVQILWVDDWYDGPMSGACLWNGQHLWFNIHKVRERDDAYVYGLYDLPAERWAIINHRHADFCIHIGEHYDYVDGKRNRCGPKPQRGWDHFSRKWKRFKLPPLLVEWCVARAESIPLQV
jgi:hypothetical protein